MVGIAIDERQRDQRCGRDPWRELTHRHERLAKQAGRPDEHHDDEEGESQHVAPFEIGKQAAERDDLGEHECRHEAADEVAEPAQHADQERDRPERQADEGMDVVLQHQQAGREAGERAAQRRGDEIEAAGVDAHQRHDLAVLGDGADRGADEGAGHEQVDQDHADQRRAERQQARVAEMHLGDLQHRQPDAEIAEVDAERDGGEALQDEQHAAGGQQLVDRRRREQRRDHQQMQQRAERRDQQDRSGAAA